jgi:hypothetical protein
MLHIVCIPRDIEYGDLFANNHLKMLWKLKVMTGACEIIINYNVFYELRYELGLCAQNYFNTGTQGVLFILATTVFRFVYVRSFQCGMKQPMSKPTGYNH